MFEKKAPNKALQKCLINLVDLLKEFIRCYLQS